MSIEHFFVRDVTVLTEAATTDRYGNTEGWATATTRETKGWLHRLSESEVDQSGQFGASGAPREAQVSSWVLRLPKGDPITGLDRVVIDGDTFEVDGSPNRAWTPGGEHHVRCALKLVAG